MSEAEAPDLYAFIMAGAKKKIRFKPSTEQPWFNITYPQAGFGCLPKRKLKELKNCTKNVWYKNPCLRVGADRVCLESTREIGMNAVQKMEALWS